MAETTVSEIPARTDELPWWSRPLPAAVALTIVLFAVAQLGDPGGYLSTDVGGKTATIEVMVDNGFDPDLGYWAEEQDPDGSLYPMYSTLHLEGKWINATTFPMLVLATPLYAVGGANLALLLPVLGTVFAALAARALARRLDADGRQQTMVFWVIGVASPATIYALDLWEHSMGLALMAWGVVAALDASRRGSPLLVAVAAGAAFGLAATMRQEALVYGFVTGIVLMATVVRTHGVVAAARRGIAMVAGVVAVVLANALLEFWLIGASLRSARSAGTAAAAGGGSLDRLKEMVITGASPFGGDEPITYAVAAAAVVLLVLLGKRADAEPEVQRPLLLGLAALGALLLVDLVGGGLRFVPGLAATTPLAVMAIGRGWEAGPRRFVTTIAVVSLPLVWISQYTGGAAPQWGGRYILTSGLLLVVVTVAVLSSEVARRTVRIVAGAGFVVTLAGVAWTMERTHGVADGMQELADRSEPVLVFHDPFLSREAGPLVLDERWLAATGAEARVEAVAVLEAAGITEVGFVDRSDSTDPKPLPGWVEDGSAEVELLDGLSVEVVTWRAR